MPIPEKQRPSKVNQKNNGVKYLITSVSLVAVLGLWNQFSSSDQLAQEVSKKNTPEPQVNTGYDLNLPPIPTVVPKYYDPLKVSSNGVQDQVNQGQLRQVGIPTIQPKSTPPITIQQVIISQPGGNNSGSNNNTVVNPPVNNTGSSH
ncbi:MAG: hypothetical protein CL609_05950 [Anaerolineaceae bacterium]|nr:hypothetical protein [Anaerolineaceae bacterium]